MTSKVIEFIYCILDGKRKTLFLLYALVLLFYLNSCKYVTTRKKNYCPSLIEKYISFLYLYISPHVFCTKIFHRDNRISQPNKQFKEFLFKKQKHNFTDPTLHPSNKTHHS